MGRPTERDSASAPTSPDVEGPAAAVSADGQAVLGEAADGDGPRGDAAPGVVGAPAPHDGAEDAGADGGADDDTPYVPPVKAYERPEVPRSAPRTSSVTAAPTQALPVVLGTVPAPAAAAAATPATGAGDPAAEPAVGADAPTSDAPTPDADAPTGAAPAEAPAVQRTSVLGAVPVATQPAGGAGPGEPGQDPAEGPADAAPADAADAGAAQPSPTGPAAGEGPSSTPPQDPGSPLDGLAGDGQPSRAPRALLWTAVVLVVLAGVYAGAQWMFSDRVPRGTQVAGVDVGGLPAAEAKTLLADELGPRAAEPVELTAADASTTLDPTDAGLSFDPQATVDGLTGFSLDPLRLWAHLTGADEGDPVVDVDEAKLDAAVARVADALRTDPVDGTVGFADGEAVATPAQDGAALRTDEAADVLTDGWLVEDGPFELPTEAVAPEITQEETDAALEQARTVLSGPVVVHAGDQQAELAPDVLAGVASFQPADGALTPTFDGEALVDAVVERTDDLLSAPDEAHFEFVGGRPTVVGGEPGTTLEPEAVAAAVQEAALGDERDATVELVQQDPENTAEALEKLGVTEVVSEFSTPLTSEPVRTRNLVRGAQLVTGTLVKPGETFSLLDTLSPIDASNGYYSAGVVSNGVHTDAVGGGLSQMATTTYNAGFFAGFEDVTHRPHSYWFSRYPAGREATIYVGSIDMQFKNDTPYGAVMQSWVGGGQLHVRVWSTKYYDQVKTWASGRTNVVPATVVTKSGAQCESYPQGNDGFRITNFRQVFRDGEMVKDESFAWTYKPDNGITCEGDG
ncbi:VanW family protein [Puerhibacterium sp. TATVAM-FAB25]|uniref:VanW family protein n=1 Tax=Puerhibacterium sp. TATVAM-FAB25 TaxID=3093699 RepID=UPI00397D4A8D